jgi:hypothetical protein
MTISHIGKSIVHNHARNFHLRNVLYVPNASKNLLSVHRFTYDNRVFIGFHHFLFLIKDQVTKKIIHRGRCVGGLYPLISSMESSSSKKHAFVATKPSQSRWHSRLGHPSFVIVRHIVSKNKLPCVKDSSHELVCDPCQQAKSHQLPYPISTSVSTVPLQLVFSDVWGPAPTSVGRHDYYVSFIDDYSKFTWIYLLKKKSYVLAAFVNFQKLVERKFDRKILAAQSDWWVSTLSSTLSFKHRESLILYHVLMLISKTVMPKENIVTLLRLASHSLLMLAFPSNSRMKCSSPPHILSICSLSKSSIMTHMFIVF